MSIQTISRPFNIQTPDAKAQQDVINIVTPHAHAEKGKTPDSVYVHPDADNPVRIDAIADVYKSGGVLSSSYESGLNRALKEASIKKEAAAPQKPAAPESNGELKFH